VFKLPRLCRIKQLINIDYGEHSDLRIRPISRGVFTTKSVKNGDFCVPVNAVPTVKITLGTPFPGVSAGNDPCTCAMFVHVSLLQLT